MATKVRAENATVGFYNLTSTPTLYGRSATFQFKRGSDTEVYLTKKFNNIVKKTMETVLVNNQIDPNPKNYTPEQIGLEEDDVVTLPAIFTYNGFSVNNPFKITKKDNVALKDKDGSEYKTLQFQFQKFSAKSITANLEEIIEEYEASGQEHNAEEIREKLAIKNGEYKALMVEINYLKKLDMYDEVKALYEKCLYAGEFYQQGKKIMVPPVIKTVDGIETSTFTSPKTGKVHPLYVNGGDVVNVNFEVQVVQNQVKKGEYILRLNLISMEIVSEANAFVPKKKTESLELDFEDDFVDDEKAKRFATTKDRAFTAKKEEAVAVTDHIKVEDTEVVKEVKAVEKAKTAKATAKAKEVKKAVEDDFVPITLLDIEEDSEDEEFAE